MEDTLRENLKINYINMKISLNPYYNGRYSPSLVQRPLRKYLKNCLNPYYNGRYSPRAESTFESVDDVVS